MPVWVRSLADVDSVCGFSAESTVPVQAYLTSGSDLPQYVVSGVDSDDSPQSLVAALTCSTHMVVQDRYIGSGRTCLVTLQGPMTSSAQIMYYGCILQFYLYRFEVVHSYQSFLHRHMRAYCSYPRTHLRSLRKLRRITAASVGRSITLSHLRTVLLNFVPSKPAISALLVRVRHHHQTKPV